MKRYGPAIANAMVTMSGIHPDMGWYVLSWTMGTSVVELILISR
jgi:hypothetical protein